MIAPATLRVVPLAIGDLDSVLATLLAVRLVRADGDVVLTCAPEDAQAARTLLARAGARAEPCDAAPAPAPGFLAARPSDLAPIAIGGLLDIVTTRTLTAGEAAARMRRRGLLRRSRPDAARVRAVLHGDDRLIGWRRVIWAERALFRAHELRGIRPIVFDHDAVAGGDERWTLASAGHLRGWLGT